MTSITLSRLNLVPDIDSNTPMVVLEEMAQCHEVPVVISRLNAAFLRDLQARPIGDISEPITGSDWGIVARYVNSNVEWTIPELQDAYAFLQSWEDPRQTLPVAEFTFGLQIPSDPNRLNACVLYKICRANNIHVVRDTTLYQMAVLCQMFVRGVGYSRNIVYNTITSVPHHGLLQLYVAATSLIEDEDADHMQVNEPSNYNALEETLLNFSSKNNLRLRIIPTTNAEAIVLAALNFRLDLCYATNPIAEYHYLHRDPSGWSPRDPVLLDLYRINPHSIRLDEYFNPHLPADLYDDDVLINLARREGWTDNDLRLESAYTLLQTAYMSCTFYHGRQLGIANDRTPFHYETISDLHNETIVCYGVQGTKSMTAFRYEELAALFRNVRNFTNPLVPDDTFPPNSIAKLKNLARVIRVGDTEEVILERAELYSAIVNTELFTNENQSKAKELFVAYDTADEAGKAQITDAIQKLFYLSMYMRGWLGEGPYPIERAPVDNQNEVDILVTQGLIAFENACADLGETGTLILNLPLLKYRGRDFVAIVSENHGRTITERLAIVKAGDDHESYDSCIRLSSNLFAITSYRYMEVLGLDPPFDVDRLRDIS